MIINTVVVRVVVRRIALLLLVAIAVSLSIYRIVNLKTVSTAIIARGEARFYSWAFRENDLADKYAALRKALGAARTIELVVSARAVPFEEAWWQVMCLYYLPGYHVVRIATEPSTPGPSTEAVVTYDGQAFIVARIR